MARRRRRRGASPRGEVRRRLARDVEDARAASPWSRAYAPRGGGAARRFETIELSIRYNLKGKDVRAERQSIVDTLCGYKALGLTHVMIDLRRDSLAEMLEMLDLVTKEIRPAVDRAR